MNERTTKERAVPSRRNFVTVAAASLIAALLLILSQFATNPLLFSTPYSVADKSPSDNSIIGPNTKYSSWNKSSSSLLLFDDKDWPELKNQICPNRKPNPRVWQKIFHLARIELGFDTRTNINLKEQLVKEEEEEDKFFTFNPHGVGYANLSNKSDSTTSFIYLVIWKGANMFIKKNLKHNLDLSMDRKMTENGYSYLDHRKSLKLFRDMNILHTPIKDKTALINTNNNGSKKKKSICIVTALRDPVSHFLAGYNEIEFRSIRQQQDKGLPKIQNKTTNPLSFARYKFGSTERFRQFVADFIGGPVQAGMAKEGKKYSASIPHIYSMTGILYELDRINDCFGSKSKELLHTSNERTGLNMNIPWTLSQELDLTGYLPSLSNLSIMFPKFVADSCPGLPPEVSAPFEQTFVHGSQEDEYGFYKAAKQIWNEAGNTARSLCALHVLDYACFDSIPIPDLCKHVYSKKEFRQELLVASSSLMSSSDGTTSNNSRHEDYHKKCFEWTKT